MIHTYQITTAHFGEYRDESVKHKFKAETAAQAKYQAYKAWAEAYRPQFNEPFKFFLKHILETVERLEEI